MPNAALQAATPDKLCKAYRRALARRLPGLPRLRREAAAQTQDTIQTIFEQNPAATAQDVYQSLGTPQQFAANLVANLDAGQQAKNHAATRNRMLAVALVLAGLLVGLAWFAWANKGVLLLNTRTTYVTYPQGAASAAVGGSSGPAGSQTAP